MALENEVLRVTGDYLTLKRYCFWRANNTPVFQNDKGNARFRSMPRFSKHGVPDFILVKQGKFIGLECKKKGGYQSEHQKIFQQDIEKAGGQYYVIRSLEDLQKIGL